jgi:hypothetical protein
MEQASGVIEGHTKVLKKPDLAEEPDALRVEARRKAGLDVRGEANARADRYFDADVCVVRRIGHAPYTACHLHLQGERVEAKYRKKRGRENAMVCA